MSDSVSRRRATVRALGQSMLFLVTSLSVIILFFIFYFMGRDAFPFFWSSTVHTFQFQGGVFGTDDVERQPVLKAWAGDQDVRYWGAMIPETYAPSFEQAFRAVGVEVIREEASTAHGKEQEGVQTLAVYLKESTLPQDPVALRNLLLTVGKAVAKTTTRTRFRSVTLAGPAAAEGEPTRTAPVKNFAELERFAVVLKEHEGLSRAWGRTREFFTTTDYNPSLEPAEFGAFSFFYGSLMVTLGAIVLAVPLGIAAAVCLSDVLPFAVRQWVKPVIEIIAAIPSVAYGFFALVVFAPLLQRSGGKLICGTVLAIGTPLVLLAAVVLSELIADRYRWQRRGVTTGLFLTFCGFGAALLYWFAQASLGLQIASGTNALNVSVILGIMALPTIVSVSEDALQAVPRNVREGSYSLGATRAETMILTVIPSAASGIVAAVILGIMRAVGETMVVWMAAGNARALPKPLYNYLAPIRTLTATIAGDMGEADQSIGSLRYHVLFAMAFCLLTVSFCMNLASEWVVRRQRRKLEGR